MNNTQNALKMLAVNGQIPEAAALAVAGKSDELLKKSAELLNVLKVHVGMYLGGEINMLVSEITKVRAKEEVYFHDKEPDGQ